MSDVIDSEKRVKEGQNRNLSLFRAISHIGKGLGFAGSVRVKRSK